MYLSSDLQIFDNIGEDCVGVYNAFAHSFSIIHKDVHKYIVSLAEKEDFSSICDDLSSEQIEVFLSNGVLIKDEKEYSLLQQHRIIGGRQKEIRSAYLHLTLECNLACEYCYIADSLDANCQTLTIEQWKEALDRLHAVGLKGINLTGGEPLLYPHVYDVVAHAKSLDIHVTLLTNGTLAHTNIEVFNLIDNCIVSLDGVEASRRKGIEHYDVLKNIFNIADKHPSKIEVRSVIVRGFEEDVEDLAEILKTHNIKHRKVPSMPCHINDFSLMPDYEKYDLYDYNLSAVDRCGAGDTLIALDSSGNIFPCQMMVKPEFCMGNILDDDWFEQYNKDNTNDLMAASCVKEHNACKGCHARQLCNGGCRASAYNLYGKLDHINEFFCDFQKISATKTIERIFCETIGV